VLDRGQRQPVVLPLNSAPDGALSSYQGSQDVMFGVRPEALTDPDGADKNAKQLPTADCHIEVVEPAGSDTFAVTALGGKQVVARLRADANVQPGTTTPLAFNLSCSSTRPCSSTREPPSETPLKGGDQPAVPDRLQRGWSA
jgi:multiple sugar transport system ATP-binding protein